MNRITPFSLLAAAALTFTAGSANAALVGHWQFDGDLNDATANANNGAAVGDAAAGTTNGKIGGAASFDGSGDAVDIAGIDALISTQYSISFWEFSNGTTNKGYFVASGNDGNGISQLFLRRDSGSAANVTGAANFGNFNQRLDFTATAVTRGQWNHHLVTVDATSGTSLTGTWYVNGGTPTIVGTGGTTGLADLIQSNLFVGNRVSGGRDFDGLIDDLQVYDAVLDADDAAALFSNPGSVIPEPSSLALLGLGGLMMLKRRRRG